ncbi:hypothetical protein WA026_003303 [Henosepilachna vigintioctopunctata]|uniref:Uncharacterized protein n=1 Tax=Henosepilachna vigintioctopunctata TaxID=420089 RepID=A0AAW1TLT7_9CUCU
MRYSINVVYLLMLLQEIQNTTESQMKLISRILLEGEEEEIDNVDLDELIAALLDIKNTNVVPKSLNKIWEKFKEKRGISNINLTDLMQWDAYLHYLPEKDLIYFIENHIGNTEFYGSLKGLTKQDTALIMSSLVNIYERDHFLNHTTINLIFELVCGLSQRLLSRISDKEFRLVDDKVFHHLHSCSQARLRWLLENMMKSSIFGPPQVWKSEKLEKLGMLLLTLTPEELISIPPSSMDKMPEDILKLMDIKLIRSFTKVQIKKFSFPAFMAYKRRLSFTSNQMISRIVISVHVLLSITFLLSFI